MAWTWRTYIDKTDPHYKDPNIIARMPMTKVIIILVTADTASQYSYKNQCCVF